MQNLPSVKTMSHMDLDNEVEILYVRGTKYNREFKVNIVCKYFLI